MRLSCSSTVRDLKDSRSRADATRAIEAWTRSRDQVPEAAETIQALADKAPWRSDFYGDHIRVKRGRWSSSNIWSCCGIIDPWLHFSGISASPVGSRSTSSPSAPTTSAPDCREPSATTSSCATTSSRRSPGCWACRSGACRVAVTSMPEALPVDLFRRMPPGTPRVEEGHEYRAQVALKK